MHRRDSPDVRGFARRNNPLRLEPSAGSGRVAQQFHCAETPELHLPMSEARTIWASCSCNLARGNGSNCRNGPSQRMSRPPRGHPREPQTAPGERPQGPCPGPRGGPPCPPYGPRRPQHGPTPSVGRTRRGPEGAERARRAQALQSAAAWLMARQELWMPVNNCVSGPGYSQGNLDLSSRFTSNHWLLGMPCE